jgi:hypothetical protein
MEGRGGYLHREAARNVCAGCPVVDECLTYALENALDYGIFGGLTGDQRKELGRPRKRAFTPTRSACGTAAGYRRHLRYGEDACRDCKDAEAVRNRHRRGAA